MLLLLHAIAQEGKEESGILAPEPAPVAPKDLLSSMV